MIGEWLMIALGVLLTAGTALFVASEFSLVTLDPAILPEAADGSPKGSRRDQSVRAGLKHLSLELSSAQVGITMTTILLGYTAQPAIRELLDPVLAGTGLSTGVATAIVVVLGLLAINGFSMLFGELIPKNFALSLPYPTARFVVPIQRQFTRLFRPLITLLNGSANALLRKAGIEPQEELSGARSASELLALVRRSAEHGTLDETTAVLLTNSIELDELTAVDVMTDRTQLVVLERDATATDVVAAARITGHSRFPIIGEDRDDIVGLVHLRKAVSVPYERRDEVPAAALMGDVPRVPETVRLGPLLVDLRDTGLQMAVVVDEYGGTSGVVTLEDVVEELVGDVADEHDPRRAGATRAADGTWLVPGVMRPDELVEVTGLRVPESAVYETLGGLVMAELGRIPERDDVVEVAGPGYRVRLQVAMMAGRRVERLRVRAVEPAASAGDAS